MRARDFLRSETADSRSKGSSRIEASPPEAESRSSCSVARSPAHVDYQGHSKCDRISARPFRQLESCLVVVQHLLIQGVDGNYAGPHSVSIAGNCCAASLFAWASLTDTINIGPRPSAFQALQNYCKRQAMRGCETLHLAPVRDSRGGNMWQLAKKIWHAGDVEPLKDGRVFPCRVDTAPVCDRLSQWSTTLHV